MVHAKRSGSFWLLIGVALAGWAVSVATAQDLEVKKSGRDLPDALKAIPAATGICRREDPLIPVVDLRDSEASEQLDLSCAKTPREATLLLANPSAKLIDLRPAADFDAWHAPNAINLTLTETLTKPYLRDKLLVLTGSGKLEAESYHACTRLKNEGFRQVFLVRGGVPGWRQNGFPVLGKSVKVQDELRITAEQLWAGTHYSENRIFLDVDRASMRALLPQAEEVGTNAADMLRSAANRKVDKQKAHPLIGFILVTSPTIADERIRELQQSAMPYPLLLYTETESDYRKFIIQHKAILTARARGPKSPGCGL